MSALRRIYLYAVSFISLMTVVWGTIGLLRSVFANDISGGPARLAGALALLLVGLPVFVLHWWLAQRGASKDPDERSARLRAWFLYGALLAATIPILQNFIALLNRAAVQLFRLDASQAFLGGNQTWADNLIAMVINLIVSAYFLQVVRADWGAVPSGDAYAETRRLARYIWLAYGLALATIGVNGTVAGLLLQASEAPKDGTARLANGLAFLLAGLPLAYWMHQQVENSLSDPTERRSFLRLAVLYGLVFIAAGVVVLSAGLTLYAVLRVVLGGSGGLSGFVTRLADPLGAGIPFTLIWLIYNRDLNVAIVNQATPATAGPSVDSGLQLRLELRRFYIYGLALIGLGAAFLGLVSLISYLLDLIFAGQLALTPGEANRLAGALATLAVGLPLWLYIWPQAAQEAAQDSELGDYARRSPIRRGYLLLVLFVCVIGVMGSAGVLLYGLLRAALGDPPQNLLLSFLRQFSLLILFILFLVYHGLALRGDGRKAGAAVARRHILFPVLILAPEWGPDAEAASDPNFAPAVAAALQRAAPSMPVAIHPAGMGAPDESLSTARAVILPAEAALRPGESLRLWLQGYGGARLVIPAPARGWTWVGGGGRSPDALARQAADMARRLAEGQDAAGRDFSPLLIGLYILAGLFGLQILLGLLIFGVNFILD
jgi:hypothetical protein